MMALCSVVWATEAFRVIWRCQGSDIYLHESSDHDETCGDHPRVSFPPWSEVASSPVFFSFLITPTAQMSLPILTLDGLNDAIRRKNVPFEDSTNNKLSLGATTSQNSKFLWQEYEFSS